MTIPPNPGWDGLHPLIVHFPVALLLVGPLFLLLGLAIKRMRTAFYLCALILMLLGTAGAFVAVATGEAAAQLADQSVDGVGAVLEEHEEMAGQVRIVFALLSIVLAAILAGRRFIRKPWVEKATMGLVVLFLAGYAVAALFLANTAHLGGRLVHEFGVRAVVKAAPVAVSSEHESKERRKEHD